MNTTTQSESEPPPDLSIVIVTYNEEGRIRECIESVFRACNRVSGGGRSDPLTYEVILVDSNSSDGTVDIASKYPISVLQLPADVQPTPAAGRYVGTSAAGGTRLLFVDGDMALRPEWLGHALSHLEANPSVGAVDGELNEVEPGASLRSVDAVRGVALYDTEALGTVGGFDPFLQSLEDIHLGFELTTAGYDLHRLPMVAAEHPDRSGILEPVRRWRRGYMVGIGQVIRRSLHDSDLLLKHFSQLRYRLLLIVWLLVGILSFASPVLLSGWTIVSLSAIGVVFSRLGFRMGVQFLFSKCLGVVGLFQGVTTEVRDTEEFPLSDTTVLKQGNIHMTGSQAFNTTR